MENRWKELVDKVDAYSVRPVHEVRDADKLAQIVSDMENNGWTGRPVLALNCGDYYQALTGSHRIAAANEAGIDVNVYAIDMDCDHPELWGDLVDAISDDDRLRAIKALHDEGLVRAEAVELMDEEIYQ